MAMTTPDSDPQPPYPYDPYLPTSAPSGSPASRHASLLIWISAGLLLIASTCCVTASLTFGVVPIDEFKKQDTANEVPQETWDALAALQPHAALIGTVMALLTLLPALVLLVLAFGVRKGRRGGTLAALWVLSLPLGVLTVMLLMSILGGLSSQGVSALANALPLAIGVGLLAWTWMAVRAALRGAGDNDHDGDPARYGPSADDPWERTL